MKPIKKLTFIEEITKEIIPDGSIVAIGGVHSHNVPMAIIRQMIRIGCKDLTLIGSISAGLPIDLLVGAGCVKKVLAPYVGFEMWGLAPQYRFAVQKGEIEAPDLCEAFPVYTLRAASNGLKFHPFPPGVHEFDSIPTQTDLYKKIRDPFTDEEVYALEAIKPDVAIIHTQIASSDGNCIHLGPVVTDRLMATASKKVIVSCEELISEDEIRQRAPATTIPGFFVDYLILLPKGAHPTSCPGYYPYDAREIKKYLASCKDRELYQDYLHSHIFIPEKEYQNKYSMIEEIQLPAEIKAEKYTIEELVATLFARDIKNGELGICGAVSEIPMVAMQLAERMHAPALRWISGGSGYVNPRGELAPSSTDFRMSIGAEARLSMNEVIPIEMKDIDFFFAGGLQIDGMGNTNLAGIPSGNGWKLRGPGSVGLPFLIRAGRIYLYTLNHSKRSLVQKVSYISGPGYIANNPYGGGPELLITNLCVFRWNKKSNKWRLSSIHPGITLDKVKQETGFEFEFDENPTITKPPTNEELTVIRSIDPIGYLRGYSD